MFKQNILGILWWKYISTSLRLFQNEGHNEVIIGGSFNAEKLLLIARLLKHYSNIRAIWLVGEIGIKFGIVRSWKASNEAIPSDDCVFYGLKLEKS